MLITITPLSQRDPRWKDQRLGMKNGTTIGSATISTYDADGFKLTWTKGGSPGAGTLTAYVLCLK